MKSESDSRLPECGKVARVQACTPSSNLGTPNEKIYRCHHRRIARRCIALGSGEDRFDACQRSHGEAQDSVAKKVDAAYGGGRAVSRGRDIESSERAHRSATFAFVVCR